MRYRILYVILRGAHTFAYGSKGSVVAAATEGKAYSAYRIFYR